MSKVNRGKDFEHQISEAFFRVEDTTIIRLYDTTNGYSGIANICDYIIYHYPVQFCIECKSCYGNTWNFHNLSAHQREGLTEVSTVHGVVAGVILWFIEHDTTVFVPIQCINEYIQKGQKSINIRTTWDTRWIKIEGRKRRVFFDYDVKPFISRCINEVCK